MTDATAQGRLAFAYEDDSESMELTALAGLPLVAETLLALGVDTLTRRLLEPLRARRRGLDEYEKLQALVLLLAAGGECVEDVRIVARDRGLVRMLGRPLPSPDALHDFLARAHDEELIATRPADVKAWIVPETPQLKALREINEAVVRGLAAVRGSREATLDLDATIIEAHKRDAFAHYKEGRGYQPTAVLWAEEDLIVADEFRDGNVPAGMAPLPPAREGFATLPATVVSRRFRGDSACYEEALLKWLVTETIPFTISADMSKELRQACANAVDWELLEERADETVWLAEVEFAPGDWPKSAQPLRYVGVRITRRQGALFGESPRTKQLAVVTNRRELTRAQTVKWHWEKAGTIEFAHDVTKNDLGLRVLPSGRYGANAAWYRIGVLTYNVLNALKRHALPERFLTARPKRLRFELFTVPARLVRHSGSVKARLDAPSMTRDELIDARRKLLELAEKVSASPG